MIAAAVTFLLTCLALVVIFGMISGCAPTSATERLRKVEIQLTIVNRAADAIDAKVEEARGTNNAALIIVSSAATRPSVPAETQADLSTAKDQMVKTDTVLGTVPADTRVIRGGAANQANTAKDAIKGEEKAKTELKVEKDHWLGYKTRVTLWVLLALLPVLGLIVFAVKVAGGGPLLKVVGELVASFLRLLGRVLRGILTPIYHLATLGASKLADKINKDWDAKKSQGIVAAQYRAVAGGVVDPGPVTAPNHAAFYEAPKK